MIKTAKGASILSTTSLSNTIMSLVFFIFFARMISEDEMGIYGAVYLIYKILSIVGILGLGFAASRYIPYLLRRNEKRKAIETTKQIFSITLISGTIIFSILFIKAEFFSLLLTGSAKNAYIIRIASISTTSAILALTFTSFLQGLQRFRSMAFYGLSSQVVRIVISLILLLLGFGVVSVFIGYIFYHAILATLALITVISLLFRNEITSNKSNEKSMSLVPLLRFSIPMMLFQLILYLSDSVDRLIVLNLLGITKLGIYTVALTGAMSMTMILNLPLQATLIPGMSEIYAKSGVDRISKSFTISTRYISILFIPMCVGLAVLSPLALYILAGSKYLEATIPLSVISISLALYGYSTALISALTVLEETLKVTISVLLASILGLVLNFLLVPYLGINGASISRIIMYCSMLLFLISFSLKLMRISFDMSSILKATISSIIMAFVLFLIASNTGYRILFAPLYLIIGFVVYGSILALLGGIKKNDILFLAKILPGGKQLLFIITKLLKKSKFLLKISVSIIKN